MSGSRKRADPAGGGRAPRDIAAEDAALWDRIAATAKPLRPKTRAVPKPKAAVSEESEKPMKARALPPLAPSPAAPARALAAGVMVDLDRRTAERLRRGQLTIDGRIDLHGMTQEDAHAALTRFLSASRAMGRRCVLIITGKGRPQKKDMAGAAGGGVLKQAVPRWLNQPSLRSQILAFVAAQPKDGGAGALYVLLKRVR
jgi:DNA-nicking Smr family endonuclease